LATSACRLAGAELQVAAVVQRQEIRQRPLDDAQAMLGQVESRMTLGLSRETV
jgi:hypothetical protein